MRARFSFIPLFAALLAGNGCVAAAPNVDMKAEKAALDNVARKFETALNGKDVAGLSALYAPDARVLPNAQPTLNTQRALHDWFVSAIKAGVANITITSDYTEIAAAGDLAVDVGTFTETVPGKAGPTQATGRYVVAAKKVDGAWKLILDMDNALPTAAPAANSASERQH